MFFFSRLPRSRLGGLAFAVLTCFLLVGMVASTCGGIQGCLSVDCFDRWFLPDSSALGAGLPGLLVSFSGSYCLRHVQVVAAFHLGVSMRWSSTHGGLASGSSGCQASRYGLLVSVQGASDSMPHSSPEGEVVAVRALLLATSLPLGMDVSLAPGRCLSVSTFYRLFSILKVLVLKCRVLPFS